MKQPRPGSLLVGTACAAGGLWLAANHPLSGAVALTLFTALAVGCWLRPLAWPALLTALLPVCGLMTWSGWLVVEELDLIVLAVAAAGYLRRGMMPAVGGELGPPSALAVLGIAAYGLALATSVQLGARDAGGWSFGWWQGYHEPLNSVRVGKSFFLALLLLPLWRDALRADADRSRSHLALGMTIGLALAAAVATWERAAFPGLMNFSTDYRTSGPFWEMHVGGAALDGYLALALPFAAATMMRAASPWRWALAATVVMLAGYAALTTFSRVLFVALPLGLAVLVVLEVRRRGRPPNSRSTGAGTGWLAAVAIVFAFGTAAAWMFGTSGWRGLLALLGTLALLLPLASMRPALSGREIAAAMPRSILLAGAVAAMHMFLDKGAYIGYALLFAFGALMLWRSRQEHPPAVWPTSADARPWALAAYLGLVVALLAVCLHWGEAPGLLHAAPAAAALIVAALVAARRPGLLGPPSPRWQGTLLAVLAMTAAVVGSFGGGDYIAQRIATGDRDAQYRLQHWRRALTWMDDAVDWTLGKGVGRYPANHLLLGIGDEPPGDYRLIDETGARRMVITGGRHEIDWGQIMRMSQRIEGPIAAASVRLRARAPAPVGLHVEVCEKHLLYHRACLYRNVQIDPLADGGWHPMELKLGGEGVPGSGGLLARPVVFSIGLLTPGGRLEIQGIQLLDERGRERLVNGDFAHGMARWYFSSDHHHMPWHMKSLSLHLLFEQGWLGLALAVMLWAGALLRTIVGGARGDPLAPVLAAALVGVSAVGLIDSLLDAPRIGFLMWLQVLVALSLPVADLRLRTVQGAK